MTGLVLEQVIAKVTGMPVRSLRPLSGGCVAQVARVELEDGSQLVAKRGDGLALEGWMLAHLAAESWPVPAVLHADDDLLLLEYVAHDGVTGPDAELQAADLLAALHAVPRPAFGFERDTVIAGLPQSNPRAKRWLPFFAEHRLLAMARQCEEAGQLPADLRSAVERLAGRLDRWLLEPDHASLVHGDLWGGNILFDSGGVAAFIDPACYWAHAEVELAFTTLFGTFGDGFFRRYQEHRPLEPGFFDERRELYNLYPLLVHLRLFGGPYLGSVQRTLVRFDA